MLQEVEDKGYFYQPDPIIELEEDAYEVYKVLEACMTQWRISDMGVRTGIDYSSLPFVTSTLGVNSTPKFLMMLQKCESYIMIAQGERIKTKSAKRTR